MKTLSSPRSILCVAVLAWVTAGCCLVAVKPAPAPELPPEPRWTMNIVPLTPARARLPGAQVRIDGCEDPRCGVLAPADGIAHFDDLAPGDYTVVVSLDGYETRSVPIVLAGHVNQDVILTPIVPPLARLQVVGRQMVRTDGAPFVWRFASGFSLLAHVAHGRDDQARAFLAWARAMGFTGVRVFSMLSWADLPPARGREVLPRALQLAAEQGLYLEVVALATTKDYSIDADAMRLHVRALGEACAEASSCAAIELANENYHTSQRADLLEDVAFLRELRALVPRSVPVSLGSGPSDEIDNYPGGDYITLHLGRGRDTWNMVRHVREMEAVSAAAGRFVVSDEPIGAGEVDESGRRSADPAVHYALGTLARVFDIGATFHFEDGLATQSPRPVQQACAEAFIAGTRIVPDDVRLVFRNAGWTAPLESPVKGFSGAVRAYSGLGDQVSIVVAVGVQDGFALELRDPWHITRMVAERPGVRVLEVVR